MFSKSKLINRIIVLSLTTLPFLLLSSRLAILHAQTFTKIDTGVIVTDGGSSKGSSWGDYDNDGDLDLFVANLVKTTFYIKTMAIPKERGR